MLENETHSKMIAYDHSTAPSHLNSGKIFKFKTFDFVERIIYLTLLTYIIRLTHSRNRAKWSSYILIKFIAIYLNLHRFMSIQLNSMVSIRLH